VREDMILRTLKPISRHGTAGGFRLRPWKFEDKALDLRLLFRSQSFDLFDDFQCAHDKMIITAVEQERIFFSISGWAECLLYEVGNRDKN
jgi:hypothetical protein